MTNRDQSTFRLDRRAVSEVVGYTLLIGITTVTVVALLIAATSLQGALQGSAETESVEQEMQDVDATFGRLAQGDNRSSVRVRTDTSNYLSIVREGEVTVTVNDNCSVQVPLSSIRHEKDGETFANELGGTIRVTDGGQAMVSSPDLHFENGTVDLTITNITGRTASSMTFVKDVNSSKGVNETDKLLFKGTCARPENVTVSITSDFADAWKGYAKEEFPAGTVTKSGNTVNVTLTQKQLPEAANPANNTVVNFRNSSQYHLNNTTPSITITKPDNTTTYNVRMKPLDQGMQVSAIGNSSINDIYREGVDIVLILDKSGSMVNNKGDSDTDESYYDEKINKVQDGARQFVGILNESDRVGIVWYDHRARVYPSGGQYLTNDTVALNSTIGMANSDFDPYLIKDSNDRYAGTYMDRGLDRMLALYSLYGTETRNRYAILLSDGKNSNSNSDNEAEDLAERAYKNGIKVYAIGYGPDADLNTLDDIAKAGGTNDSYYADSEAVLEDVLEEIRHDMLDTKKKIVHDPASVTLGPPGSAFEPNVPGSSGYLANHSGSVNINDPTLPANFSFTFSVDNNVPVEFNAYKFNCTKTVRTGKVIKNQSTNQTYFATRCANMTNKTEINGTHDIYIFRDGDTKSQVEGALGPTAWYQSNYSTVLPLNGNTLNLSSNQAIIGINYSTGQRMLLLFEIGRSKQSNDLSYIVDVNIDDVKIQEKDEQN